jgi:EAL domain-containing protein (putative c-di-GMP-specific phosphodiesterase class I)
MDRWRAGRGGPFKETRALDDHMSMGRASGHTRVRVGASAVMRGAAERAEVYSLLDRSRALRMAVQPIMDLRTGRLAGYEALARFPGGRPPDACFAQAYAHGLGFKLEAAAVRAALQLPARADGAYLSINLSAAALASDDVQSVLPDRLDGLVIEITEHEPLGDEPELRAALDDIRARGARLAVDDAGSGYAGLKSVAALAPDIIKLDRTLIQGVHRDPVKAALIEAFVRYSRVSGAAVVAEGIETLEELTRLAELDVSFGQGYGIARPDYTYPTPARAAVEACTASMSQSLSTGHELLTEDANDRRLEALTALLSRATSYADLVHAVEAIAAELRCDEIALSARHGAELVVVGRTGPDLTVERYAIADYPLTQTVLECNQVAQVLASDPGADPAEVQVMEDLGFRSLLMLPVACAGETIGLLEAFSRSERPWSRFEIRRARIISHQVGAIFERVQRHRRGDGLPTIV